MASKYLQKYPIPGSFPDLLHDFAREVLRDQPEDIYDFGAEYFRAIEEVSKYVLAHSRASIHTEISNQAVITRLEH